MVPRTRSSRAPLRRGATPLKTVKPVELLIATVRGRRVILSADLAQVYGVPTKALNRAVRRNPDRFPPDFVFVITRQEAEEVRRSRYQSGTLNVPASEGAGGLRYQSGTLKRGDHLKYAPLAFTEHGAVMAATVLNSPRAVQMSIFVVRAFLRLREWLGNHAELAAKLAEVERRVSGHDKELQGILGALRQLLHPADDPPRRRIGFSRDD